MIRAGHADTAERDGIRRTLRWLLGAQIVVAALLVIADFGPRLPEMLRGSDAPELDQPVAPGDQTRRYRPNRPAQPGPGIDPDMPRRIEVTRLEIDDRPALRLRGAIAEGDGARLNEALAEATPEIVLLDSPGGRVMDGLEMGRALRAAGVETRIEAGAICYSACPYVFFGGVRRGMAETAQIGVHQHSYDASVVLPMVFAIEDIQRGQAMVVAHLVEMGIDLEVMQPALATPAEEIYILSEEERRDWRIVTD